MKLDLAPLNLSNSNDTILKLVSEFNQDFETLKQCLSQLSKLNTQISSNYLFNHRGGVSTELKPINEMEEKLNRIYWILFFKQVPLKLITNKVRLKEIEETLRYGEIGSFTYENIQNLIQQLYIEKYKVNVSNLTSALHALSSLDCAKRQNSTHSLPSLIVIKNMYTASNQEQIQLFDQVDAIRRAVKEDMHHPTFVLPIKDLIRHSKWINEEWVSIDTDLFRFKVFDDGSIQVAFSEQVINILAKNTHGVDNQIVKMEWVAPQYESTFKDTSRQFDELELVALGSVLDQLDSIKENSEIHIPFDRKNEGIVLLSLPFNWAFKILTTGIGESERCGFHKLRLYELEIEHFVKNIFQSSFDRPLKSLQ